MGPGRAGRVLPRQADDLLNLAVLQVQHALQVGVRSQGLAAGNPVRRARSSDTGMGAGRLQAPQGIACPHHHKYHCPRG